MLTFTWTEAYENSPTEQMPRNQIDSEVRRLKRRVGEIMNLEHDWIGGDGSHRPGLTSVVGTGTEAEMNALENPEQGALFFVTQTGVQRLYIYVGSFWVSAATLDHQALLNRNTGNPHPQYLQKGQSTASFAGNLDMQGNILETDNFDFLRAYHVSEVFNAHESHVPVVCFNDVLRRIAFEFLVPTSYRVSVSGSSWDVSENGHLQVVEIPINTSYGFFAPNIYVNNSSESEKTVFCMSGHYSGSNAGNTSSFVLAKPNNGVSPSYRFNIQGIKV